MIYEARAVTPTETMADHTAIVWRPPTEYTEGYWACTQCAAPVTTFEQKTVRRKFRFFNQMCRTEFRNYPCGHALSWLTS